MTCNQYHFFSPSTRALLIAILFHAFLLFLVLFTILHQNNNTEFPDASSHTPATVIMQPPSSPAASQGSAGQTSQFSPSIAQAAPVQPTPAPSVISQQNVGQATSAVQEQHDAPKQMHLDQPPINPALMPEENSWATQEHIPQRETPFVAAPVISERNAGQARHDSPQPQAPQRNSGLSHAVRARQAIRKARTSMHAPPKPTNTQHTYETFIPTDDNASHYDASHDSGTYPGTSQRGGSGTGELSQEELTHALNQDFAQNTINKYKSFVMYALCYELNKQNIHASPQETQQTIVTHITVACNGTITNVHIEGQRNSFAAQVIQGIYAASPVREIPPTISTQPVTFIFTIRPNSSMGNHASITPGPIKFFIDDPLARK